MPEVVLKDQLSFGLAFNSIGYSQNPSAFDDDATIYSGSAAVINLGAVYEHFTTRRISYFATGSVSGLIASTAKYFSFGGGMRFYFRDDGTLSSYEEESKKIKVRLAPKLRYFAGFNLHYSSMVYETPEEIRADAPFEIGGHGGAYMPITRSLNGFGQLTVLRGVGVETTSFNVQLLFGVSFYINSLL